MRPSFAPSMTKDSLSTALDANAICVKATNGVCMSSSHSLHLVSNEVANMTKGAHEEIMPTEGMEDRLEIVDELKRRLVDLFGEERAASLYGIMRARWAPKNTALRPPR